MTVAAGTTFALAPPPAERPETKPAAQAARQFESLLLRQLLNAMWKTAPAVPGAQGDLYRSMFEEQLADHLTDGGGIGLSAVVERAFGGGPDTTTGTSLSTAWPGAARLVPLGAGDAGDAEPDALRNAAAGMLAGSAPSRWAKDGTLTAADLRATASAGSEARSSVRRVFGYGGYFKCNVFAFELAKRAGFAVPGSAPGQGGLPSTNRLTQDARDGRVDGGWARVVTGASAQALDARAQEGGGLLLTGSGMGERHGHMAIVERVHSVDYGPHGELQTVVFDGWEARPQGAAHLRQRTWNRHGHSGGNLARNGFQSIEILELSRAEAGPRPEPPGALREQVGALRSSPASEHPKQRLEDEL